MGRNEARCRPPRSGCCHDPPPARRQIWLCFVQCQSPSAIAELPSAPEGIQRLPSDAVTKLVPVADPLRTPVGRAWPVPQSDGRPDRPCHARDPPLLPRRMTRHRCSPAELPDLAAISGVDDMRHSAAEAPIRSVCANGEGRLPAGCSALVAPRRARQTWTPGKGPLRFRTSAA
jgi:hypothetical protein